MAKQKIDKNQLSAADKDIVRKFVGANLGHFVVQAPGAVTDTIKRLGLKQTAMRIASGYSSLRLEICRVLVAGAPKKDGISGVASIRRKQLDYAAAVLSSMTDKVGSLATAALLAAASAVFPSIIEQIRHLAHFESEALAESMAVLDGHDSRRVLVGGQAEAETGWDLAIHRTEGRQTLMPQHASDARKRIRAAAAPAFAAALDRAVDPTLLQQFAARHPGGIDLAKLRAAYAEAANRAFAADFVRLVGGQPPASAEDIALGAIIAVAIAQTTARYPIVPAAAVAPMAVLVHRTLRPRLAELARMAAMIAAASSPAPAAPRPPAAAPQREMAW